MNDKIILRGMTFYGYHGVLPEEKSLGQLFIVDVTIHLDLTAAGNNDCLEDSVDYSCIYHMVKNIVEVERFNLVEALAERVSSRILAQFKEVKQVTVAVTKPGAPIAGVLSGAGVELTRRRLTRVYLSLGSNIEPKEEYIHRALRFIASHPQIVLVKASSLYYTEPVGYQEQDWFLNAAAACDTDLTPMELLREIQRLELVLQRQRNIHWGPRTIDIDIIFYGQEKIDLPELKVPHPRALERAFVLVPLAELSDAEIADGKTAREHLKSLKTEAKVEYYGPLTL